MKTIFQVSILSDIAIGLMFIAISTHEKDTNYKLVAVAMGVLWFSAATLKIITK